ncbi:3-carboxy-cis,cis-muconate cycloisomerase [Arthrobacter sp. Hiyo1]|nr:3-carboxy-cis,cis-muconate cycloisomerase [Arthrobacter sp. Hiyo1]
MSGDGDFGLLSPVSASPAVVALTGDRAVIAAILDVEAAWASVLEEAGFAPAGSAAVVTEATESWAYDAASIAERAQGGANPVIPLLADLRGRVKGLDASALAAVHTSLTSQDVLDSALMLLAHRVVSALLAEVKGTTTALAGLAEQHADTLCVGRSLTQHALPFTFGLKAAQWFHGVAAAARRLEALEFPVQFGGASGTLAAGTVLAEGSSSSPFILADALAGKLGLAPVPAPWHTNRLAVTGLGDALASLTDSFGKIASDLLFLSRPEVAELGEPLAAGRGVSSAMPQKQNPVLSVLIRSAALQAPGLAAQLHVAATNFNDERPDGAWHSEWPALRGLLRLTLGAAPSCASSPKASASSPRRCAATWKSPGRCSSAKPSHPPLLRSSARTGAMRRPSCRPSSTRPCRHPQRSKPGSTPSSSARPSRPASCPTRN